VNNSQEDRKTDRQTDWRLDLWGRVWLWRSIKTERDGSNRNPSQKSPRDKRVRSIDGL